MKHCWSMAQHGPWCLDMGQRLWSRKMSACSLLIILEGDVQGQIYSGFVK